MLFIIKNIDKGVDGVHEQGTVLYVLLLLLHSPCEKGNMPLMGNHSADQGIITNKKMNFKRTLSVYRWSGWREG